MITHVVLIQPKAPTSHEKLLALLEDVQALQEIIPGILSISVGENLSLYHRGFTYGVIMRFVDEAHLQAHHTHPAHVAVVTELDNLCQQSIDFDLPEPTL
jgi:antibiotic biosynthesis monooxygenase (ABM) superfamily enzyme